MDSTSCVFSPCHITWPSDYQSDLDNRCVWSRYEKEGCEQHEYSLWRHRFTDCSVDVTLRSDCLGGQGGWGFWTQHIYVISRSLPVADNWIDEDGVCWDGIYLFIDYALLRVEGLLLKLGIGYDVTIIIIKKCKTNFIKCISYYIGKNSIFFLFDSNSVTLVYRIITHEQNRPAVG